MSKKMRRSATKTAAELCAMSAIVITLILAAVGFGTSCFSEVPEWLTPALVTMGALIVIAGCVICEMKQGRKGRCHDK